MFGQTGYSVKQCASKSALAWSAGLGLLLSLLPGKLLVAAEQADPAVRSEALVSAGSMVQMLIALVVVVAIIVGLSILVRRLSLVPGASGGMIRIVSSLALNSKDRLLLVQVGEEQILISASPGRIGKVHELQAPVDTASFDNLQKAKGKSFNSLFTQVLQGSRQ